MRNAGLDEAQAGIKVARRNTTNLRYADATTLMGESEEELKGLLIKKKETLYCSHCFPVYLPRNDGTRYHDLRFLNVEVFHSLLSLSSRGSSVPLHLLP